jgi:hypothetical protein
VQTQRVQRKSDLLLTDTARRPYFGPLAGVFNGMNKHLSYLVSIIGAAAIVWLAAFLLICGVRAGWPKNRKNPLLSALSAKPEVEIKEPSKRKTPEYTRENMIPKMRIQTNSPSEFMIQFKTWDITNFETMSNLVFKTPEEAQNVINGSLAEAELRFKIGLAILEAFHPPK